MKTLLKVLEVASRSFTPYVPHSGTEHMATLLYSLVRMTRPRSVVEFGAGYTTFFLLAACSENAADVLDEAELLGEKTSMAKSSSEWFARGGLACGVDPSFYLLPYKPRVYCFERQATDSEYAMRLRQAVDELGLAEFLDFMPGTSPASDALPPEAFPIDIAWNDDCGYSSFYDVFWPRLNPSGGLMIFHNTAGEKSAWQLIDELRRKSAANGESDAVTLVEPHKLNQNSCTILRRTSEFEPPFVRKTPVRVATDLADFIRARSSWRTSGPVD